MSEGLDRRFTPAVAVVALLAFVLRAFVFVRDGGSLGWAADYDEGVYFSAGAYLLEGVLPYRDYVFVHPPGVVLWTALTSAWTKALWGIDGAFAWARWLSALLGTANTVVVACIVRRRSTLAAIGAALFYATYLEAVVVERGPFLEPVLNLACLSMTWLLVGAEGPSARRVFVAGLCGALALAVKVWAGAWLVAAVVALWNPRRVLIFVSGVAVGTLTLLVPFALTDLPAFIEETLLLHAWRPPDGVSGRLDRLFLIIHFKHLGSTIFAVSGLAMVLARRAGGPMERLAFTAWALTLVGFFAASAWWDQYNSHLIASEALAAGVGLTLFPWKRVAMLAVGVTAFISANNTVRRSKPNDDHFRLARSEFRDAKTCVFTFEPSWSLTAGRLPPLETGPLIDSYGSQLLALKKTGQRFSDINAAFAVAPMPEGLRSCAVLFVGGRGLFEVPRAELERTHVKLNDEVWVSTN